MTRKITLKLIGRAIIGSTRAKLRQMASAFLPAAPSRRWSDAATAPSPLQASRPLRFSSGDTADWNRSPRVMALAAAVGKPVENFSTSTSAEIEVETDRRETHPLFMDAWSARDRVVLSKA